MTIRAYKIQQNEGESFHDFCNRVTSMDITFDTEFRNVIIHNNGYIEVDGTINGLTEINIGGT
jgi:hypothetical protein